MSSPRGPVRRPSSRVYRRRRAVALLAVVLVVVVLVVILVALFRGGGNGAMPTSTGRPHASGPAAVSPSPQPSVVPTTPAAVKNGAPCRAGNVDVEAYTDAASYGAGRLPKLWFSITDTGTTTCTIDVGTDKQVFTITSGLERYWTSTDCQTDPVKTVVLLQPGKTLTSQPISWSRTRSSATTCKEKLPQVPADGASYHFAVSVGGVASRGYKQFLLY